MIKKQRRWKEWFNPATHRHFSIKIVDWQDVTYQFDIYGHDDCNTEASVRSQFIRIDSHEVMTVDHVNGLAFFPLSTVHHFEIFVQKEPQQENDT